MHNSKGSLIQKVKETNLQPVQPKCLTSSQAIWAASCKVEYWNLSQAQAQVLQLAQPRNLNSNCSLIILIWFKVTSICIKYLNVESMTLWITSLLLSVHKTASKFWPLLAQLKKERNNFIWASVIYYASVITQISLCLSENVSWSWTTYLISSWLTTSKQLIKICIKIFNRNFTSPVCRL